VAAIVAELRKHRPGMKVLLPAIFPRSAKPDDPVRLKVKATNALLANLGDGKTVIYKDIGDRFLEPDGTLSTDVMPDRLHLSGKGYDIWAKAIADDVRPLVK
jgi:lysophospholipase L1-like esterase